MNKLSVLILLVSLLTISCNIQTPQQIITKKMIPKYKEPNHHSEYKGYLKIASGIKLPFTFSITSKGNGTITLANDHTLIHVYDSHNEGLYIDGFLLNNYLSDVNNDGYKDLVLKGKVHKTHDKTGEILDTVAIYEIYYYDLKHNTFTNGNKRPSPPFSE